MDADKPRKGAMTTGISFTPAYWEMLQAAMDKGFNRSRVVTMALDALKALRPEIFLPIDYSSVISVIDEKQQPAATGPEQAAA